MWVCGYVCVCEGAPEQDRNGGDKEAQDVGHGALEREHQHVEAPAELEVAHQVHPCDQRPQPQRRHP
jgi:hypothetical protein